jgi:Flp pilus assembly protein TadD
VTAAGRAASDARLSKATAWIGVIVTGLFVAIAGFTFQYLHAEPQGALASAAPHFVGSETCSQCHQAEAQLWQTSQHKHAMEHASDTTVKGDFVDRSFDHFGVRSRFFRQDGKFLVETDGPDGKLATFEIKYTFGVEPLQQYLVAFPDGRVQALPFAWDTRPKEQGGQRWFHLYPDDAIKHDDVLHWTKLNQNWNFMCAECHSTGVVKNYDAASDRFATHFAEISVGCEACHGQGSRHFAWAQKQDPAASDDAAMGLLVRFDERQGIAWQPDPATGLPRRSAPPAILRKEVETCGLCHARRSAFSEDWTPGRWLSDTHAVSGLTRGLFEADGQIRDEVYNYGAFKQSKMFAKGVTCSDCHEPHNGKLRITGDGTCLQCHAGDRYETAAHTHHEGTAPALTCASCHMPERSYMAVDRRHDHSFRIPRPDLSVSLDTPNACNGCHAEKSPAWAASAIEHWFGPKREGYQHYAEAFHAAFADQADADGLLAAVAANRDAPGFARGGALEALASHVSRSNAGAARNSLKDPDPMVRIGALEMLEGLPPQQLWPLVASLLSDESQGVRIKAASLLAGIPTASQPSADRAAFEHAAGEFIAAQRLNADRPEARSMLANFFAKRGLLGEAEIEWKAALRLSPQYAPAATNLADLYRGLGRDDEGLSLLRATIAIAPGDAGLHHALGLTLVRMKQSAAALTELQRAAGLDPNQARFAYVYAVALHSSGRGKEALAVLKDAVTRHPNSREFLSAMVSFSRSDGDIATALENAEHLARISPDDAKLAHMIEELRRQLP